MLLLTRQHNIFGALAKDSHRREQIYRWLSQHVKTDCLVENELLDHYSSHPFLQVGFLSDTLKTHWHSMQTVLS